MLNKFKHFLHPFLFSLFPILSLYQHNQGELDLSVVALPLLASGVCALLFTFILKFFLGSIKKSGIAASIGLLLFFSFGHILAEIKIDERLLLVLLLGIYTIFVIALRRAQRRFGISNFLTIVSLVLIINSLFSIIRDFNGSIPNLISGWDSRIQNTQTAAENNPDIYYLVLDRYSNNVSLREEFNYDNTPFTDYLEQKGFFVSYESFANYPKTNLSLASTLNMKHLTYLTEKLGKKNTNTKIAFQLLYKNTVVDLLKGRGYEFIYLGGWWGPTQKNDYADYNFNLFAGNNEFNRELLKTTVLKPFLSPDEELKRQNIIYKFNRIKQMPDFSSKPKFVFAHMLLPHYPYIFDSQCRAVPDTPGKEEKEKYIAQLKCTNKLVRETIEAILAKSNRPPVIIIQSDEGQFKYDEMRRSGEGVDWTSVSDKAVRVHMRILNAYYLPNTDYSKTQLYNGISPVNSFRVLFNYLFGTDYDLLPDTSYFIPHLNYPYDYFEVTDRVKFNQ